MKTSSSCSGISFKSQAIYMMVYATRYLDIFWTLTTGSLWNTTFKILFLASQSYVIYLMLNDYKPTHDPNIDTFKVQYLLGGSAVLAILFPYRYQIAEILWAFSIWLESVAILPQLFMLQRTGEAETITTHYLFALGLYRALYIPNWLYRYFAEGYVDQIPWIAGTVQTILYSDFFWIYYTKVLQGKRSMRQNFFSRVSSLSRYSAPKSFRLNASTTDLVRSISVSPSYLLAQVRQEREVFSELWFSSSSPCLSSGKGTPDSLASRNDERTLKLGKTLRLLQSRLPTLLTSPLPQEVLSPQIKLHLFPSTHPHLPTVSGRVAYHAALWSAPVAWGRVPIVGNVKLKITSERMVKCGPSMHSGDPSSTSPTTSRTQNERLIVRWRTCSRSDFADHTTSSASATKPSYRGIGAREQVNRFTEWLSNPTSIGKTDEEFCGLFIFDFDEQGRIATHTIEHAEEGGSAERASRVVNLTDWLLGRARGGRERLPELAWVVEGDKRREGRR
ncbi:MAG: hypothetical protein Q9216_000100 [Gyalolechia sp. 2 TL-2023]